MYKKVNVNKMFIFLCLMLPVLVFSQGYVQQVGTAGNVNWTQQTITCTGYGGANPNLPLAAQRAGAIRAAKVDALRNLLETINGVNISSETTVENHLMVNDVIHTRVEGILRGFQIKDTKYMSTGDVEVDVEVSLTGQLLNTLLPNNFGGGTLTTGGQLLCPTCGQPWPEGRAVPAGVSLVQASDAAEPTTAVYTGLIVDARGLGCRPAMAPKLVDENGKEVYGSKFVSREYATDIGMVGYEKDISRAKINERVADNPLIVKGIKTSGPNKTDLVIGNTDALKIHNAAQNMNFLQHCKVMYILD